MAAMISPIKKLFGGGKKDTIVGSQAAEKKGPVVTDLAADSPLRRRGRREQRQERRGDRLISQFGPTILSDRLGGGR